MCRNSVDNYLLLVIIRDSQKASDRKGVDGKSSLPESDRERDLRLEALMTEDR